MTTATIGPSLKQWRARRSISQLDLAYGVGVSPKHLSFVETGKSNPSVELVIALAAQLEVPLRERNALLLAAGYAPRYEETPIDDPSMRHIRQALRRLLDAHDPYPGMVLDRQHNIVLTNAAADQFIGTLPDHLRHPVLNMFRASLHPEGFAANSDNFDSWGLVLLGQLRRLVARTGDEKLAALESEVRDYPNVQQLTGKGRRVPDDVGLVVPTSFAVRGQRLEMFSTLTSFGSPRDITLDGITVELFFPANDETDRMLSERHTS